MLQHNEHGLEDEHLKVLGLLDQVAHAYHELRLDEDADLVLAEQVAAGGDDGLGVLIVIESDVVETENVILQIPL